MSKVESITEGNFTVDIFHDEDCPNPREWEGSFLWLGFPHRGYTIGDETIDPTTFSIECARCTGDGYTVDSEGDDEECPDCRGDGYREPSSSEELIEFVTIKYKANLVVPVGMIDHSRVSYYLGGGPHWSDSAGWDSGTCGLMLFTEQHVKDWGSSFDDDEVRRQMSNELDEYTAWCNGDCYGYRVRLSSDYEPTPEDREAWIEAIGEGCTDGLRHWCEAKYAPDDSCWGFVGYEYAESEALSALKNAQPTEETE